MATNMTAGELLQMEQKDKAELCRILGLAELTPEQEAKCDELLATIADGIADEMAAAILRGGIRVS